MNTSVLNIQAMKKETVLAYTGLVLLSIALVAKNEIAGLLTSVKYPVVGGNKTKNRDN